MKTNTLINGMGQRAQQLSKTHTANYWQKCQYIHCRKIIDNAGQIGFMYVEETCHIQKSAQDVSKA